MARESNDFHIRALWLKPSERQKIERAARHGDVCIPQLALEVDAALDAHQAIKDYAQLDPIWCFGVELRMCLGAREDIERAFMDTFQLYAQGKQSMARTAFIGGYVGKTFEMSTPEFT